MDLIYIFHKVSLLKSSKQRLLMRELKKIKVSFIMKKCRVWINFSKQSWHCRKKNAISGLWSFVPFDRNNSMISISKNLLDSRRCIESENDLWDSYFVVLMDNILSSDLDQEAMYINLWRDTKNSVQRIIIFSFLHDVTIFFCKIVLT